MSKEGTNLYIAEFDEVETLGSYIYKAYLQGELEENEAIQQCENLFIHAFLRGFQVGYKDLDLDSADIAFFEEYIRQRNWMIEDMTEGYFDGKTWKDRLLEHFQNLDGEYSIKKLLVTEYHRDINKGLEEFGNTYQDAKGEELYKTWETMQDDRVRDTHDYLDGVKVKIGDDFYTYNGDHAPYPGRFGIPEEDCNCRCRIRLAKE